jgi:hypothetical protein
MDGYHSQDDGRFSGEFTRATSAVTQLTSRAPSEAGSLSVVLAPSRTNSLPSNSLRTQSAIARLAQQIHDGMQPGTTAPERATTRISSAPVPPVSVPIEEFAFAHLSDRTRRAAFGMGRGWDVLEATHYAGIDSVFRNLAVWSERSEDEQSWVPLLKMGPTIAGKMAVAIGADLLTLGLTRHNPSLIGVGACSSGVGILVVMVGMQALMFDMRRINPGRVPITLVFSFCGMLLVSGALIFSETDLGSQNLGVRGFSALLFGVGLTLLNTSLPLSFAYSEMVHGDTFRSYRNEAAFLLWGVGLGLATGLTVARGATHNGLQPKLFPFGVAHGFAVLGIACATLGTCFVATNLQRQVGLLLGLRTRVRQLASEVRGEEAV